MIHESRLHTCPSYSCLISLQEKPNGWNTMALSAKAPAMMASPLPMLKQQTINLSSLLDDAPCYRDDYSPSPLSVSCYSDSEDDSDDSESELDHSEERLLLNFASFEEPLKGGGDEDSQRSFSSGSSSQVRFHSTVSVQLIPSHRIYSYEMKQRMWTSLEEIRVNAVRSKMLLFFEEEEMLVDEQPAEERKFTPLGQTRRSMS